LQTRANNYRIAFDAEKIKEFEFNLLGLRPFLHPGGRGFETLSAH